MDYTTVNRVKQELHIQSSNLVDDALLAVLVTTASRAWDRKCTGVMDVDADDYFKLETVASETLEGQIDYLGKSIICYPHKPIIKSVSSFSYKENLVETAYTVDVSRIEVDGPRVRAYPSSMYLFYPSKCRITIAYSGGLGATVADLPDDMQEAVAILTARFYREAETGLTDQIGVAELATMVYTKAWPIRVTETLDIYKRRVGWRHVA